MNRSNDTIPTALLIAVAALLLWTPTAAAQELFIEPEIESRSSSNVYLTRQAEWDVAIMPRLNGGLSFARHWTAGFSNRLSVFPRHSDLMFHRHELYLFANPTWGAGGKNELLVRLSAQTQRNAEEYSSINHLKPILSARLVREETDWWRWELSQDLSLAWFYDDQTRDTLDAWVRGSFTLTAQTRTTVSPRVGYGFRYYTHQDQAVVDDSHDQQVEVGVHLSQGLADRVGLQLDYAYLDAVGPSGLVLQQLSTTEVGYIGEEFLFSGHRAGLIYKQVFGGGWTVGAGLLFETRDWAGWMVVDSAGAATGEERRDRRISPNTWVEYTWWPREGASRAVPEGKLSFEYAYLRQWSNDPWYDTSQHVTMLNLALSWLM